MVGYYQANELCDDLELGPFGKKIAQKIRSVCPLAACLLIDGARMQPTAREPGLLPLDADGKRSAAALSLPDAAAVQRLDAYLQHGARLPAPLPLACPPASRQPLGPPAPQAANTCSSTLTRTSTTCPPQRRCPRVERARPDGGLSS